MSSTMNENDAVGDFIRSAEALSTSVEDLSEDDRSRVLLKLYELTMNVESPWETFVRLFLSEPAVLASVKILQDLNIFKKWKVDGSRAMTCTQLTGLAERSCDAALLCDSSRLGYLVAVSHILPDRLLRLQVSNNIVEMTSDKTYKPTRFCDQLADSNLSTTAKFYYDHTVPMFTHMPIFFRETSYRSPRSARKTVFDSVHGWQGGLFAYLKAHPEQSEAFNTLQRTTTLNRARWTSIFPSHTLLDSVSGDDDPGSPLLVDIGGSMGQDLQAFYELHPETASRLYLEDLPSVLADEKTNVLKGINKVAYDFYTPQPIKHARAYYMHHILHDWPDKQACRILEMQKAALKPGYSRILIHDQIMDDDVRAVHPHAAVFDISMMAFGAAGERTEKEWRALIESVGLRVVKIWRVPGAVQGVIEVGLREGSRL
ncbi:O-methyltransferase [Colletotrichum paranaense]|uniref:O-methyltransferase n=1 Tax=Colletotrichum paranaense TaxID=1914294 RepID=A0ABQ9SCV4_9PEZI|nr:O-methyltransferase [Colletotrichum paranaense]KAK1533340.1 O-methyltransferase [Colletotrichum paranaense]